MVTPAGLVEWPKAEAQLVNKLGDKFEAILKQYQAGTIGGANDGGQGGAKPAATMGQSPAWISNVEKDLGSQWGTGPQKGQILAPDAQGKWGFTSATAIMGNTALMSAGALLGPVERPINSVYNKLPLGSILLGGGSALIIGTAIDDLYPHGSNTDGSLKLNATNLALKGGLAFVMATFGARVFSGTGALIAAAVFGLQVAADLAHTQVEKLVAWIVKTWRSVTGRTTTASNRFYAPVNQGHRMDAGNFQAADNHPLASNGVSGVEPAFKM